MVGIGSRAGSACSKLVLGSLLKVTTWRIIAIGTGATMFLLRYVSLWFIPPERMVLQKISAVERDKSWFGRALKIVCNPSMLLYFCVAARLWKLASGCGTKYYEGWRACAEELEAREGGGAFLTVWSPVAGSGELSCAAFQASRLKRFSCAMLVSSSSLTQSVAALEVAGGYSIAQAT